VIQPDNISLALKRAEQTDSKNSTGLHHGFATQINKLVLLNPPP